MKKILSILFFALILFNANAQDRATIDGDTARYLGKSYVVGDTIQLGYGSKSNKDFAFIQMGTLMSGVSDMDKGFAKSDVIILSVYKVRKQIYLKAKVPGTMGNKAFIDLEGAVDNKEIRQ